MMLVCLSCRHAIRVIGDPSAFSLLLGKTSEYWPNQYPCANDRCEEKAMAIEEPELEPDALSSLTVRNLSPEETFAAIHSYGFPEEHNCCEEVLQQVLGRHGIRAKGHQHPGVMRYYLDYLELADGTRLYLAPSSRGACVYRITKPQRTAGAA